MNSSTKDKNNQTSFKTINRERRENYSTAKQRTVRTSEQVERNPKVFQPESLSNSDIMGGNKDKNNDQGDSGNSEGTMGDSMTSP